MRRRPQFLDRRVTESRRTASNCSNHVYFLIKISQVVHNLFNNHFFEYFYIFTLK